MASTPSPSPSPSPSPIPTSNSLPADTNFNRCIFGWLDDIDNPSEAPLPPPRAFSPTKRQRTLDTTSNPATIWPAHLDSVSVREPSSVTSASRASSPSKNTRTRLIHLQYTDPAISLGPPKQSVHPDDEASVTSEHIATLAFDQTSTNASIPPELCDLIKRLSEGAANPNLPSETVSHIIKVSPTEFLEPSATNAPPLSRTSQNIHKHVCTLFGMARKLYAGAYEEAAWYPLVRTILLGPESTNSEPFTMHEEAHTRLVCSDLLPQKNGIPIPPVKIDHVLQFNPDHELIGPLYTPVFQSQPPGFSLSAFNDPIAARTFTCAVVEVKAPGGDFQEASYQVAIISAAILERVKQLGDGTNEASNNHDFMPAIGWIVHGHFWTLHVSYREINGSIRVLGPYPSGNTVTFLDLYRLIRIVQEVKDWGEELYFPYLAARLSNWH